MENKFLEVAEVAHVLNTSAATVRNYADSGKLKATRTERGQRLFVRSDVDAFLRDRQQGKTVAVNSRG